MSFHQIVIAIAIGTFLGTLLVKCAEHVTFMWLSSREKLTREKTPYESFVEPFKDEHGASDTARLRDRDVPIAPDTTSFHQSMRDHAEMLNFCGGRTEPDERKQNSCCKIYNNCRERSSHASRTHDEEFSEFNIEAMYKSSIRDVFEKELIDKM